MLAKPLLWSHLPQRSFLRTFCDGSYTPFPVLTSMERVILPHFFYSVFNIFMDKLAINLAVDPKFKFSQFMRGARQAVFIVSQKLSEGKVDELEDIVTPQALSEIRKNMKSWSVQQRSKLCISENDILFSAPYRSYFAKEGNMHRLELDILMQYVPQLGSTDRTMSLAEFTDQTFIANYSFLRYYENREAVDSWKINNLNHFNHVDETKRRTGGS